MINKPDFKTIPEYYHYYTNLVQENNLLNALEKQMLTTILFLKAIPEEIGNFRYAENKWSVKEVISHIMDTERIMCYRALRFSRKDKTELAGYDENLYAPNSNAQNRNVPDMLEEYEAIRRATIHLFRSMNEEMVNESAIANKYSVTVKGIGWMIAGHELHHIKVIKEKYL